MTAKKKILFICAVMLIPALLCACSTETEMPRWSFGVEGAEIKVFSSFDYSKLDEVSITVKRTQANGDAVTEELQGVYLKDVLKYINVSEYSSIMLTSRSDLSVEYTPEIIEDPTTLLVFEVNGRTQWENGIEIVQVVSGSQPEDMWLWNLKTLTVNP